MGIHGEYRVVTVERHRYAVLRVSSIRAGRGRHREHELGHCDVGRGVSVRRDILVCERKARIPDRKQLNLGRQPGHARRGNDHGQEAVAAFGQPRSDAEKQGGV